MTRNRKDFNYGLPGGRAYYRGKDAYASQSFENETRALLNEDVSLSKLGELTALSVIGNPTNAVATPSAVAAGADGAVLRRSGTALGFGTIVAAGIAAAAVTYAKIQAIAGLSVMGRTSNSSGDGADITAGTDGHILRRSGTALGFGKILTNFITGTATNDNATAGDIGEYLEASASFGSVGSWTTTVLKNITSLSLSAGDYLVEGFAIWSGGAITGTYSRASLSTTSATHDTFNVVSPTMPTAASSYGYVVPPRRVSLSSTTTIYLVGDIGFTGGTPAAGGFIRAWRVR